MKCKMAIVILNYINYEDTLECVKCALKQKGEGYQIIVVDNGSDNESFDILRKEYGNVTNVTLLRLDENAGFARGNNYGIQYARKKFRAEYIFICNSDVIFSEDLFEKVLAQRVKGIGAISPPVYDSYGIPQAISLSTNHIYLKIISTILQMFIMRFKLMAGINKQLRIFRRKEEPVPSKTSPKDRNKNNQFNYQNSNKYNICGCAFFLTPEFFKYYEQLYPKTFLYWEEINLIVYLSKAKLQAVLKDLPPVVHKGKKSIIHIISNKDYEKKQLNYSTKSMIKSLPMFFRSYVYILAKYN